MKQLFIILIATSLVVGCSSDFFKPATAKIPGVWTYQKVRVFKPFSFLGEDETQQYLEFRFHFFSDGSMNYFNEEGDINFSGFWQYRSEWVYNMDRDNDERIHFLDIHLMDNEKELEDIVFTLEDTRVSSQRITGVMYVENRRISVSLARKNLKVL